MHSFNRWLLAFLRQTERVCWRCKLTLSSCCHFHIYQDWVSIECRECGHWSVFPVEKEAEREQKVA